MSVRAGFVGLIGLPNAGKSTLANALIGERLSIVSEKPQTTRGRVLGIWSAKDFQAILVDAPGKIEAPKGLNAYLAKEYHQVIEDSDLLVAVLNLDAKSKDSLVEIIEQVKKSGKHGLTVITKTDLPAAPGRRAQLLETLKQLGATAPVLEFSNQWKGRDAKEFRQAVEDALRPQLPEANAPLYDEELYTPHATREVVREIIREQCFRQLHLEVPYGIAVVIQKYREEDKLDRIEAEILVMQDGHKPIVLGKGGARIKSIGQDARKEIEKLVGRKVFLGLQVKVKENWDKDAAFMRSLGYFHEK